MFMARLFTKARRKEKQPKCPSADEWLKSRCSVRTLEGYRARKGMTFSQMLQCTGTSNTLAGREVTASRKGAVHTKCPEQANPETESRLMMARGRKERGIRGITNRCGASF